MHDLTTLTTSSSSAFIQANTDEVSVYEIERNHLIPVFAKDNERCISHTEFIRAVVEAVKFALPHEQIFAPAVRVSHPVHGRTPEAKNKKPSDLLPHEKTLYYERMMFNIEVPSVVATVGGKLIHLNVGGVKAFNLDKLSGKSTTQHFKVFIGFQVKVCSNLCVATDGAVLEFEAFRTEDIFLKVVNLINGFNQSNWAEKLEKLAHSFITRESFEQLIGKLRLQLYDPNSKYDCMLGDQQMGQVVRGYFTNPDFKALEDGSISLWNVYNLLTEANKSSYVDRFLHRASLVHKLVEA